MIIGVDYHLGFQQIFFYRTYQALLPICVIQDSQQDALCR
jgi:hypothetical protein